MDNNYFSTLNEEQKKAVSFDGKHLLVLAGAGTGKTKTIVSRALYLINKGVSPNKILILSFTRKSAREIVNRIKTYNIGSLGITGQTFHSWCMGIIKNNPDIFKCSDYTCIDEEDRESIFKLLWGRNFKNKHNIRISPDIIAKVYSYAINVKCSLSESIRCCAHDKSTDESVSNKIIEEKPIYEQMIKLYMQYKADHSYIDYDDILNIVSTGLLRNKDAARFISSQYEHILIDEMQDTNPLQYELLSSFYENCHLFCVGDDAQSIYGFRGADFASIHNFTKIVDNSKDTKLSLNYRSTQEILDISNWLLSKSLINYNKELKSFRGNGEKPKLIHVRDSFEEANHITDDILKSIADDGFEYKDNLVLSRSVYGTRQVEAACIIKKIPYQLFGGASLMQSKHVRDLISALRVSSNFKDEIAWNRYLQLWKKIGNTTSARIISSISDCNSLDECIIKLQEFNLQKEIIKTLIDLKQFQSDPSGAITTALNTMGDRLSEIYEENGWEGRKLDFDILKEVALNTGSITEFISEYLIDPSVGTYDKRGRKEINCVTISTIHSAKGLEAKSCYIVNVSPLAYPTPRAILNGIQDIEEERRCLYVAMTRAKDKLYMYRNIAGTKTNFRKTKFRGEIKKGDIFYKKKDNNKSVEVVNVLKQNEVVVIYFKRSNSEYKDMDYMIEERFRELFEKEDKEPDYYFLNDITDDLIQIEVIGDENNLSANTYMGEKISADLPDFNFD